MTVDDSQTLTDIFVARGICKFD